MPLAEKAHRSQWIPISRADTHVSTEDDEELDSFIECELEQQDSKPRYSWLSIYPSLTSSVFCWQILCLLLAIATGVLVLEKVGLKQDMIPSSFATDFEDSKRAVEYEQRIYTGELVYDAESSMLVRVRDSDVEYFGPPSQTLNKAWDKLLDGRLLAFTEAEAAPYLPALDRTSMGDYMFEPDMFHSLHCVNSIRELLASILYPDIPSPPSHWTNLTFLRAEDHYEHCLDRLRQTVLCHGDLTPSVFYRVPHEKAMVGKSGSHTCRKLEPIKEWLEERREKYPLKGHEHGI